MNPNGAPCIQPVWPVKISSVFRPARRQASSRKRAVVRLPRAQSVPRTAMRGAATSRMSPLQKWSSVRFAVLRTSVIVTPLRRGGGGQLGVVGDELVQTIDDRHSERDGFGEQAAQARRHAAARGRDADDAEVRSGSEGAKRLRKSREDRDAARPAVEHLSGVAAGGRGVDDAEDAVAVRPTHEAVGGLSVGGVEEAVADDERGPIHGRRIMRHPLASGGIAPGAVSKLPEPRVRIDCL